MYAKKLNKKENEMIQSAHNPSFSGYSHVQADLVPHLFKDKTVPGDFVHRLETPIALLNKFIKNGTDENLDVFIKEMPIEKAKEVPVAIGSIGGKQNIIKNQKENIEFHCIDKISGKDSTIGFYLNPIDSPATNLKNAIEALHSVAKENFIQDWKTIKDSLISMVSAN